MAEESTVFEQTQRLSEMEAEIIKLKEEIRAKDSTIKSLETNPNEAKLDPDSRSQSLDDGCCFRFYMTSPCI